MAKPSKGGAGNRAPESIAIVPSWGKLTLGLACLSFVFSSIALWTSPGRSTTPAATGSCEDPKARADLAELRKEVGRTPRTNDAAQDRAIEHRLESLEARIQSGGATTAPGASTSAAAPTDAPRKYVRFEVPIKSVAVSQAPDGSLSVKNTDPGLAGKVITISAVTADGDTEEIHVTVPPP
jgi:hypothetical protein